MLHSQNPERAVALTGIGVVAPLGNSRTELLRALVEGRHGMRPLGSRVSTAAFQPLIAGLVDDVAWRNGGPPRAGHDDRADDPCVDLALGAALEAWRDAGLERGRVPAERIGLVLGTSAGGLASRSLYERAPVEARELRHRLLQRSDPTEITRAVAECLAIAGPRVTVSTACTSSTHAVAHARDILLADLADVVVAGGVDVLVEELVAGFCAMGALSSAPCAPFSFPIGLTLGEGAGFVVLERHGHAIQRAATVHCSVRGAGLSADGWHPTAPDPSGKGIAQAMSAALADAAIEPAGVEYLNVHGTGTEANDAAELRAIGRVFGERARSLPFSSTKGHFGHALGAAGILELIATVLCLEQRVVPPTLHWSGPRGAGPIDPVPGPAPRSLPVESALKSSAGFGGSNAAIVVSTERATDVPSSDPDEVFVIGAGAVGPFGWDGYDATLRAGRAITEVGRVPSLPMARLAPRVDMRGMPALARFLLVAAELALSDAGISLRGELGRRSGLFVGAHRPAWEATRAFFGSIFERGYERASAPAFAQLVMNASVGLVSTALGLRGAQTLVAGRRGAALASVGLAAQRLALQRDTDLALVGAASEATVEALQDHLAELGERAPVPSEGAALVVLAAGRAVRAIGGKSIARIAATSAAGPGGLERALGDLLTRARWSAGDVNAVYCARDGRNGTAKREERALAAVLSKSVPVLDPGPIIGVSSSLEAFALVAAVEALRREPSLERVAVVVDDALAGAWAVALEKTS